MHVASTEAELLKQAKEVYARHFSGTPTHAASAPGRVNIIGEHVDYCDGFVLPMALEQRTMILGRPTEDHVYTFVASNMPEDEAKYVFTNNDLAPTHGTTHPHWADYVIGVVAQFKGQAPGFEAVIVSNVPIGGGLSSSAALEVSTHTFVEALMQTPCDPAERARRCQNAEHDWANMPCGIMDQAISSMGKKGHLLLLDCRTVTTKQVPFSDPNLTVVITNSNVKHKLTGSEYPTRRRQTEEARDAITAKFPDVKSLRDATMEQIDAVKDTMDPVVYQRGHHVIGEIARTTKFADLLSAGHYKEAGQLMYDSHWSLSKDFGVSTAELDLLVEIASKFPGVYGSRMTGGGFGGCTVTLIERAQADAFIKHVHKAYTLGTPSAFISSPGDGAHINPL